jgi:hypothetical protein
MTEPFKQFLTIIAGYLGAGAVGSLLTILITHRLALSRDRTLKRESDIREDRLEFIPYLNKIIKDAGEHPAPISVWNHYRTDLEKSVWRFRLLLSGRRQRDFDEAWEKLKLTDEAELVGNSKTGVFTDNDELRKTQQILISRVKALLKCVERA